MKKLKYSILASTIALLAISIFITFILYSLSYFQADVSQNYEFTYNSYRNFPEESPDEYLIRYDINDYINNNNIDQVIEFYSQFTNDYHISRYILINSLENNIPVNLGFSIAWVESRFNPRAINSSNQNGSRDYGLFQLNSRYHSYTIDEYFNPHVNSYRGTQYFGELLVMANHNFINAIYAYNAGPTRVLIDGEVPDRTIRYAQYILEYEDTLNQHFNEWVK